ncbi:endonuclease V [Anaerolineales bacterium HSG6]|nr:endonuclease V [Anaerolineales bacterium HSG6]MDM8531373.1 endonuclease V [Anaerolineales bacterium HSG25]
MKLTLPHKWKMSSDKARALQKQLASQISRTPQLGRVRYVAGVGVHVRDQIGRAAAVVLDYNTLKPVDMATAIYPVTFPFKPNLIAFRDAPVLLEALARLEIKPDLFIADGHGIAHPRQLGFASHIGVLTNIPTIGCSRASLGEPDEELGATRGCHSFIRNGNDEIIGASVRTQTDLPPLYVSIGHRVDLETSIKFVLSASRHDLFPEAVRLARRNSRILGKVPKLLQNGYTQ